LRNAHETGGRVSAQGLSASSCAASESSVASSFGRPTSWTASGMPFFEKPIGTYEGRGALWSFNGYSRWVPYCAAFNHSGQPAASIPVGFTPDGFPLSVQLVGRPDDEATLLSLSAQMEQERPWAERVPDVAK